MWKSCFKIQHCSADTVFTMWTVVTGSGPFLAQGQALVVRQRESLDQVCSWFLRTFLQCSILQGFHVLLSPLETSLSDLTHPCMCTLLSVTLLGCYIVFTSCCLNFNFCLKFKNNLYHTVKLTLCIYKRFLNSKCVLAFYLNGCYSWQDELWLKSMMDTQ